MKISFQKRSGLTLIEVLAIIAMLVIAAFILLHKLAKPNEKHLRFTCDNNLKQVGLSFRIYAGDNRDRYPMNSSTNNGSMVNEMTPVYKYFLMLSNELGTVKAVTCPDDKKQKAAADFTTLSNSNISYFIGLDAHETFPQSILSGDRNITNGLPAKRGILGLTTNQMVDFTGEIHNKQGNIAIGDGSVQQVSSARLRSEIIQNSPFATNRIKLP